MAKIPILKKSQTPTCSFSLCSPISQRIVASDPVTERLGPRSTPISTARAMSVCVRTRFDTCNPQQSWATRKYVAI